MNGRRNVLTAILVCMIILIGNGIAIEIAMQLNGGSLGINHGRQSKSSEEPSNEEIVAGSEYIPGKVTGHSQVDEADMLDIVWNVFSQDIVGQVYCGDYDRDGWMEAFVEIRYDEDDDYCEIWFVTHNEKKELIDEGDYLNIGDKIELPTAALLMVNGRQGMDTLYFVDSGVVGMVGMPDNEWWYSVYEENGVLMGIRVEYPDEKDYVEHELRYDPAVHELFMIGEDSVSTQIAVSKTTKPTAKPTAKPTTKPTAKPTAKPTTKPTAKPTAKPTVKPTAKPTATPKPIAYNYQDCEFDCKYGDNGSLVKRVQQRLIALGYLNDSADGKYGSKTRAAVEAFQRNNGIHGNSNAYGVATTLTQAVLFSNNALPSYSSSRSTSWKESERPFSVQMGDYIEYSNGKYNLHFEVYNKNTSQPIVALVVRYCFVDSKNYVIEYNRSETFQSWWYNFSLEPNRKDEFVLDMPSVSKVDSLWWNVTEVVFANGEVYIDHDASNAKEYDFRGYSTAF